MKNLLITAVLTMLSSNAYALKLPKIVECAHFGATDMNGVVYAPTTKIFSLSCNCPPPGQGKCTLK